MWWGTATTVRKKKICLATKSNMTSGSGSYPPRELPSTFRTYCDSTIGSRREDGASSLPLYDAIVDPYTAADGSQRGGGTIWVDRFTSWRDAELLNFPNTDENNDGKIIEIIVNETKKMLPIPIKLEIFDIK